MREGFILESAAECATVLAAGPGVHVLAVCHGETECQRSPESVAVAAVRRRLPVTLTPGAALVGGHGFRWLRLHNGSELVALPAGPSEWIAAAFGRTVAGHSFRYVWPCPHGRELTEAERAVVLPAVDDAGGLIPHC